MNRYLRLINFRSLCWRGLTALLLLLTACATPATPASQETPVAHQVELAIQTDQQQISVGYPVAIVMNLNPPAAITEATWTVLSGEGDLEEKTKDVVIFTPSKQSDLTLIQVEGKTADGATFKETISFKVVAATQIPPEEPTQVPAEEPAATVNVEETTESLVTQDTLQDEQTVPCENLLEGTYAESVTDPIWPVIYVGARYHFQDENNAAPPMDNGKWFATVRFGDCTKPASFDSGKAFQLLTITAGPACQEQIAEYFATARAKNFPGVPGLVEDCEEVVDRITVIRE